MRLLRYTAIRLGLAIPVLAGIMLLTFVLTHVLIPVDPAVLVLGEAATPETLAAVRSQLGTDQPLLTQFLDYLNDLAHGDLGTSYQSGQSVLHELFHRIPATLELITLAIPLAFVIGIAFAILSAGRRGGARDASARGLGAFGIGVPDYYFALILILLFYTTLHWAPGPLGQSGAVAPIIPTHTGAYFIDAIIAGQGRAIGLGASHLVLPVAVLALHYSSHVYRVARASMEETMDGPFVDYSVMMGTPRRSVWKAIVSNALPPVLTITGTIYGLLLGGAVIIEVIFSWNGVGQYGVKAIEANDYLVIQGFVLVTAVFCVLVFLAVDLFHAALDPRVRSSL